VGTAKTTFYACNSAYLRNGERQRVGVGPTSLPNRFFQILLPDDYL